MVDGFSQRARQEADRYGSDPWIFVRELLQNARDAGARSVSFTTGEGDGLAWIRCRDDGEGMSFEHAQRFLFTLYASSKEGKADEAGRFGVGFWSILRFEPSRILIRSWPKDGSEPWEIALEGGLSRAVRQAPPPSGGTGTELVLERARSDEPVGRSVADAARQTGRFLTRKEDPRQPLTVTVDGAVINEPFALPAPSVSFQRGRLRGVVGLGAAPRVELFSKGLRIRSAVALEDLLSPPGRNAGWARLHFPPLADGLAPQALLECEELEVLLSRRDARDTPALRRLVRLAQRELENLIEQQIAFSRGDSWGRRLLDRFQYDLLLNLAAVLLMLLLVLGGGKVWMSWRERQARAGYRDLAAGYRGPAPDVLERNPASPGIRYTSAAVDPIHLAALEVAGLDEQGRPILADARPVPGYQGTPCASGCVELEVRVNAGKGMLRLPVPTGHRLDTDSLRFDGRATPPDVVFASTLDEPVLLLSREVVGTLRYRTGPGAPLERPAVDGGLTPSPALAVEAARLRQLPPEERARQARDFVRNAIAWSATPETVEAFQAEASRGVGFVERSLRVGAGDCDVQNGVLMLLLQQAGIPARMALGYVGRGGALQPRLHAWVEYDGGDGRWRVLDASEGTIPAEVSRELAQATPERAEPAGGAIPPIAPPPRIPAASGQAVLPSGVSAAPDPTPPPAPPAPASGTAPAPPAPASGTAPAPPAAASGTAPPPPARAARATPAGRVPWRLPDPRKLPKPLALIALAAMGGAALSRRSRRSLQLDPGHDLTKLLRGVLESPAAFRNTPSIVFRRIIPCLGGRALSLDEARRLADRGRLYSTGGVPWRLTELARRGAAVVDRRRPEGALVATSLGAVDLDAWKALSERTTATPLLQKVNTALERLGQTWSVFAADQVPGTSAILTLPTDKLWDWGWRELWFVILDERLPWLVRASQVAAERPEEAILAVVDRAMELRGVPDEARASVLARLARDAVREAARP